MRRLAAVLLRGESGDDVVQDAWETVMRHPPRHADGLPSWLRRVVGNRARNVARASARRRNQEGAAGAMGASATAPSPEQIADVLEGQKTIATLMAALDAARRQVIYLRFYEDLAPVEIARRLGEPAGTIRWRLKSALDEMRARLDDQHGGDRNRWRALLLPLTLRRPSTRLPPGWPPIPWLWWATLGAATASLAGLLLFAAWPSGAPAPTADPGGPVPSASDPSPPAPPGPRPLAALAPIPDCPEVDGLSARLQVRRQEIEARPLESELFARSEPNPAAQQRFGKAYEAGLQAGRCLHELECRGPVCRARLLVPDGAETADCFPERRQRWIRDHLAGDPPSQSGTDVPIFDPAAGQSFSRRGLYYRLARLDGGAASPGATLKAPPPPLPDLLAAPSLPAGRTAACRAAIRRAQADLLAVETRLSARLGPAESFAAGAPRPDRARLVKGEMVRLLKLDAGAFPFRLECRGNTCAVSAEGELDPLLANHWDCNPPQDGKPQICVPHPSHGWYRLLEREAGSSAILSYKVPPSRHDGQERPAYLTVRGPHEPTTSDEEPVFCRLSRAIEAAGVLARCQTESPPDPGELRLRLMLVPPNPAAPSRPPAPTLHHAGPLAGRPLGRCIVEKLTDLLADFSLSEGDAPLIVQQTLRFPHPRPLLPRDNRCDPM